MPAKKVTRKKHVTITAEAYAEVAFTPRGPMPAWNRRAAQAVEKAIIANTPTGSRPHWAHTGKRLKDTISSQTAMNAAGSKAHFTVGSSSYYAAYVDQGTGGFDAKILPPWSRGSASLFEHTWKPSPNSAPVGKLPVKGQKAQRFFGRGLQEGMAAMGIIARPTSDVVDTTPFPRHITQFPGDAYNQAAFRAQLEEWRKWRDKAWADGKYLGRSGSDSRSREVARRRASRALSRRLRAAERKKRRANSTAKTSAERGREFRERQAAAKGKARPKRRTREDKAQRRETVSQKQDRANFKAAMIKKYGRIIGAVEYRNGRWYATVPAKDDRGRNIFKEVSAKAKSG